MAQKNNMDVSAAQIQITEMTAGDVLPTSRRWSIIARHMPSVVPHPRRMRSYFAGPAIRVKVQNRANVSCGQISVFVQGRMKGCRNQSNEPGQFSWHLFPSGCHEQMDTVLIVQKHWDYKRNAETRVKVAPGVIYG